MTQVIVDAEMLAKLSGLSQPLEFCDPQGRVLGHFVPDEAVEGIEPGISWDEMRHRSETFNGKALSDLLSEWEKEA